MGSNNLLFFFLENFSKGVHGGKRIGCSDSIYDWAKIETFTLGNYSAMVEWNGRSESKHANCHRAAVLRRENILTSETPSGCPSDSRPRVRGSDKLRKIRKL